jgi:hypothetical protein
MGRDRRAAAHYAERPGQSLGAARPRAPPAAPAPLRARAPTHSRRKTQIEVAITDPAALREIESLVKARAELYAASSRAAAAGDEAAKARLDMQKQQYTQELYRVTGRAKVGGTGAARGALPDWCMGWGWRRGARPRAWAVGRGGAGRCRGARLCRPPIRLRRAAPRDRFPTPPTGRIRPPRPSTL